MNPTIKMLGALFAVQAGLGAIMWWPAKETSSAPHPAIEVDAAAVTQLTVVGRTAEGEAPEPVVLAKEGEAPPPRVASVPRYRASSVKRDSRITVTLISPG